MLFQENPHNLKRWLETCQFFSQNYQLYAILSKHPYKLTDADCLANFEIVKPGISIIAEEILAACQRQARIETAKKAIAEFKMPNGS